MVSGGGGRPFFHPGYLFPWEKPGNTLPESIQICKWIEEAGVDGIHVSTGSIFPHPLNPPGTLPLEGKYATDKAASSYDTMLSSGNETIRNFILFNFGIWSNRRNCIIYWYSISFLSLNFHLNF